MRMSDMELLSNVECEAKYKTELRRRLHFADEALAVMEIVEATLKPDSPKILSVTVRAMLKAAKEQGRLNDI